MIEAFAFYLFAGITVLAGFMVISSKNPVHSVLYLILAFFNSAGLFVLLGAEFLAMILVVVYVGAVAVLFLFVVMMLDINFTELRKGVLQYLPIGAFIGIILALELIFVIASGAFNPADLGVAVQHATPAINEITNTDALGRLIYTDYIYVFQAAGLVLFVAMVGAIVLTHRRRAGVKRQDIGEQLARRSVDAIEVKKVESGKGI